MAERIDKTSTASDTKVDWNAIPFPPTAIIETKRLNIRPLHIKDAPRIVELADDDRIANAMSNRFPHPYTFSDAEYFIEKFGGPPDDGKPYVQFCLTLKSDPSQLIGCMGIHPGGDVFCRTAEMGYWVAVDYQGKGYASEAARAVTNYAFGFEDGLKGVKGESLLHVSANIFGYNIASRRVLEKIGFKLEGTQRGIVWKRGKVSDLLLFGKTKEDWDNEKA